LKIKMLKALQLVFMFSSVLSILCFGIFRYLDIDAFFYIGNILLYGWIINPVGLIMLTVGFYLFLGRKNSENKSNAAFGWGWYMIFFALDLLLYLTCGGLLAILTGGV